VNTLTVWRFETPGGAETGLTSLRTLAGAGRATVDDAALVSWPVGRRTPLIRELGGITGPGELWHGFWGMLLGLIFLTPLAGPAFGAAAGAVAGSLGDFGIADDFVMRVRDSVTPDTSALFILSTRASAGRISPSLDRLGAEALRTELSLEQVQLLRDALADR
jgi:uncharacterized membrane protein